jgi:phytoene desaturase
MAPSALIYFLGSRKKVDGLCHHNLFFDTEFESHAKEIYDTPQWPTAPQFYVACPSQTDNSVAPPGGENLFILIPTAAGLVDAKEVRNKYLEMALDRIETMTGCSFRNELAFTRSYAHSDFILDYNAFRGNAYGLANTLRQTANLKPSIVNKKLVNMFYTGQLTVPGPGVPPAIISGQVTATQLLKKHRELVTS